MTMKKIAAISLLASAALGVSLQAFANDQVTFYISAPQMLQDGRDPATHTPITYTMSLVPGDSQLAQISQTQLQFGPHTNVYNDKEVISKFTPETESGYVTVYQQAPGSAPFVRCQLLWEHQFWKSKEKEKSTHDRFRVEVLSKSAKGGCVTAGAGQRSHSGQTVYIRFSGMSGM